MHYLQHSVFIKNWLGLFSIIGFPWSQHIPFLADVNMETNSCSLLYGRPAQHTACKLLKACPRITFGLKMKICFKINPFQILAPPTAELCRHAVGQKRYKGSDETMEIRACSLL
jgi:hypothetical protein